MWLYPHADPRLSTILSRRQFVFLVSVKRRVSVDGAWRCRRTRTAVCVVGRAGEDGWSTDAVCGPAAAARSTSWNWRVPEHESTYPCSVCTQMRTQLELPSTQSSIKWYKINGSYSIYFILFQICGRPHIWNKINEQNVTFHGNFRRRA